MLNHLKHEVSRNCFCYLVCHCFKYIEELQYQLNVSWQSELSLSLILDTQFLRVWSIEYRVSMIDDRESSIQGKFTSIVRVTRSVVFVIDKSHFFTQGNTKMNDGGGNEYMYSAFSRSCYQRSWPLAKCITRNRFAQRLKYQVHYWSTLFSFTKGAS